MEMHKIGHVTHYFDDIHTATVELTQPVSLGDTIWFGEQPTGFSQTVESLQIDDDQVETAESGAVVAIHVDEPVEVATPVFK